MTDEEFAQIISLAHVIRGVEFKGPGSSSDRRLFAQVVKAMLGMTDRHDGGRIVIGVEDQGSTLNPIGLDEGQLAAWNYDDVSDRVAVYADPGVGFDLEVRETMAVAMWSSRWRNSPTFRSCAKERMPTF